MPYVLVVDDNTDASDLLCTFLRKSGYAAECAASGRQAVNSIMARTPDAIVLDLYMPDMDGSGFLEVLRSYIRFERLPVIVWTALADGSMAIRARQLGVKVVLTKGSARLEDIGQAIRRELGLPPIMPNQSSAPHHFERF